MDQLTGLLAEAIAQAGISVQPTLPQAVFPRTDEPFVTVCPATAEAEDAGLYRYLGAPDGREQYGCRMRLVLHCDIYSPPQAGGAACTQMAGHIAERLLRGVEGLHIVGFTVGPCSYSAEADCFTCRVGVTVSAYACAIACADGTEFEDFILKGEIT